MASIQQQFIKAFDQWIAEKSKTAALQLSGLIVTYSAFHNVFAKVFT